MRNLGQAGISNLFQFSWLIDLTLIRHCIHTCTLLYRFSSVRENVLCLNQYFPGQWDQTGLTRVSDKLSRRIPLHPQPIRSKNDMLLVCRNVCRLVHVLCQFSSLCIFYVYMYNNDFQKMPKEMCLEKISFCFLCTVSCIVADNID